MALFSRRRMFGGLEREEEEELQQLRVRLQHLDVPMKSMNESQTLVDDQLNSVFKTAKSKRDELELKKAMRGWFNEGWWLFFLFLLVGTSFIVTGISINAPNYNCGLYCGIPTGGRGDKTKGTWIADLALGTQFSLMSSVFNPWMPQSKRPWFSCGFALMSIAWLMDGTPSVLYHMYYDYPDYIDKFTYPASMIILGVGQLVVLGGLLRTLNKCCCFCLLPFLVLLFGSGAYSAIIMCAISGKQRGLVAWKVAVAFQVLLMFLQFVIASCFLGTRPAKPPRKANRVTPLAFFRKDDHLLCSAKVCLPFYLIMIFFVAATGFSRTEPWISNLYFNDNALWRSINMLGGAFLFWVIHDIRDYQTEEDDLKKEDTYLSIETAPLMTGTACMGPPAEDGSARGCFRGGSLGCGRKV